MTQQHNQEARTMIKYPDRSSSRRDCLRAQCSEVPRNITESLTIVPRTELGGPSCLISSLRSREKNLKDWRNRHHKVLDVGSRGIRSEQWHELVDSGHETQRQQDTLNSQSSVLREPGVRFLPRALCSEIWNPSSEANLNIDENKAGCFHQERHVQEVLSLTESFTSPCFSPPPFFLDVAKKPLWKNEPSPR